MGRSPTADVMSRARPRLAVDLPWDLRRHPVELLAVPLAAALTAFGFGAAASHLVVALTPMALFPWWLYLTMAAASLSGVYLTVLFEALGLRLASRSVEAGFWLLGPTVVGALLAAWGDGWGWHETVSLGLLPGLFTMIAWSYAVLLGGGCARLRPPWDRKEMPESVRRRMEEEELRRDTFGEREERLARDALARQGTGALVLLVAATALATYISSEFGLRPVGPAAAILGALCFAGTLALHSAVELANLKRSWQEAELDGIGWVLLGWARGTAPFIALFVLLALLAPADVSPLARDGVGSWFESLSERIAPWFVRQDFAPPHQVEEVRGIPLLELLFTRLDGVQFATPWMQTVWGWLVWGFRGFLLFALGFAVWRLLKWLRLGKSREAGSAPGRDAGLIRQLFAWLRHILQAVVGMARGWAHEAVQGATERAKVSLRDLLRLKRTATTEETAPSDPRLRVRFLFRRLLQRYRHRGIPRQPGETAYEFARRVEALDPEQSDDSLRLATDAYVKARYRQRLDMSLAERAVKLLEDAMRSVRRLTSSAARRTSADPQSRGSRQ